MAKNNAHTGTVRGDAGVAAVVVTYNNKNLLLENIQALLEQHRLPEALYIIDNQSNDGTPQMLLDKGFINQLPPEAPPQNHAQKRQYSIPATADTSEASMAIHYIRKHANDGGAGGFHAGIQAAFKDGHEWIWIMDDDTIPYKPALQMLLDDARLIDAAAPLMIGSTAVWSDGQYHPMNFPVVNLFYGTTTVAELQKGIIPVKSTSFVSVLIHRAIVAKVGLPIRSFFIWNDDYEYTRRISRHFGSYVSTRSKVLHKTPRKHQATEGYSWKYYYEVRNKLWLIFKLDTFTAKERLIMGYDLLKSLGTHVKNVGIHRKNTKMIGRAIFNGLFKKP